MKFLETKPFNVFLKVPERGVSRRMYRIFIGSSTNKHMDWWYRMKKHIPVNDAAKITKRMFCSYGRSSVLW